MNAREAILGRVREALGSATDTAIRQAAATIVDIGSLRNHLPPGGETDTERRALFAANSKALTTEFIIAQDRAGLESSLREIANREDWQRVGSHGGRWAETACAAIQLPVIRTDAEYDRNELEQCNVAITECEALIAQTGSVLVTTRSSGGRVLSVLPPHHVVIATRDQLLPDLAAAYALLQERYCDDFPSFMSFITGPSRTGDIERIIVLGAHGPKKLTVVLVDSDE